MNAFETVVLRGGVSVPLVAYTLVLNLESRGVELGEDHGDLLVGPPEKLTDADRRALRDWKPSVLQMIRYQPPGVQ